MPSSFTTLRDAIASDPGLLASVSAQNLADGLAAVSTLTTLLAQTIDTLQLNDDGVITASDVSAISAAIQSDSGLLASFTAAHGDDAGGVETGFHLLQGNGGSLTFRGQSFIDRTVDGIFHFGFPIVDGTLVNEDGTPNVATRLVAGWINFFLNGQLIVNGTEDANHMSSGSFGAGLEAAANELFFGLGGDDKIEAVQGNDTVWAGDGADTVFGMDDDDLIHGEAGADSLRGGDGQDWVYGGSGRDKLEGGAGNDVLDGGLDADALRGAAGADTLSGGAGADTLIAGDGADRLTGGAGLDLFVLQETQQSCDTIVFAAGDSGRIPGALDRVLGFVSGVDKIDLQALGPMTFETGAFSGTGASCYQADRVLRIDVDGNGTTDMALAFQPGVTLTAADFLFG